MKIINDCDMAMPVGWVRSMSLLTSSGQLWNERKIESKEEKTVTMSNNFNVQKGHVTMS